MNFIKESKDIFKDTGLHLRTGISYMLPVLLIGGFFGSVAVLGKGSEAQIWVMFSTIGEIGLKYFVPVMSAYIAYSIADTPGIAPGFIIGILAQQTDSGYLGALFGGILVGYATFMVLKIKLPEILQSTWGMIAPVFSTLLVALMVVFIIGPPLAKLMEEIGKGLHSLGSKGNAGLGAVMGVLGGVDYGGPLSKTQSTFATAAMDLRSFIPLGITGAFVTVPPLGLCLATFLKPKLYTKTERKYAKSSWVYTLVAGFTEIAIPLAANDIIRCTVATVCGCVVTGSIAGFFALELYTPVLGIPQWFFYNKP
ncbi:MAG: PTS fructose transporter subunit IIC, partial [Candidatus Marinimicrobia bacterium]|nr:PTS fructose transporter subunit IIC [Candidatus Neomarinimicrobiota bacterium]